MSSFKTPNLNMHRFAAPDVVDFVEVNDNFTTLDRHMPVYPIQPTENNVRDIRYPHGHVFRYGAKGDGINDDTIPIQDAIYSGYNVYFPPGHFKVTDTLTIDRPGTHMHGVSSGQSFIIQYTNNIPVIRIKSSHFRVGKLHLSHNIQQTAQYSGGSGIELGDAEDSSGAFEGEVHHLICYKGYRGIAIPTYMGSAFAFENTFKHIRVLDAWDTAFFLNSTGVGLTTNTFINCYALFQENANGEANGFFIGNHDDFVMINCADDHGNNRALTIQYCRGGTVIDFHAEKCRLKDNFRSIVFVEESVVNFTNLQVVYTIAQTTIESYMLFVGGRASRVRIDNFTERDTERINNAFVLSLVTDGQGELIIENGKYMSPAAMQGKSKANHHQWHEFGPPTVGKWAVGDIIWNKNTYWNTSLGWACTRFGEFGTAEIPEFQPFGIVGNTFERSNFGLVNSITVEAEMVSSAYGYFNNFEVPGNFNQVGEVAAANPVNCVWSIGASNETAANVGKYYKYSWSIPGTAANRDLMISGFKRGTLDGIPIMRMNGEEINSFNIPFTNFRVHNGNLASRPTNPQIGSMYFDTTLNKPIWFNGTSWIDAMGTALPWS